MNIKKLERIQQNIEQTLSDKVNKEILLITQKNWKSEADLTVSVLEDMDVINSFVDEILGKACDILSGDYDVNFDCLETINENYETGIECMYCFHTEYFEIIFTIYYEKISLILQETEPFWLSDFEYKIDMEENY